MQAFSCKQWNVSQLLSFEVAAGSVCTFQALGNATCVVFVWYQCIYVHRIYTWSLSLTRLAKHCSAAEATSFPTALLAKAS